ncbi:MAG: hypothetical protein ACPGPH_05510 [Synechococcus sp.]
MAQKSIDKRNPDRIERWFAEIWNSTEKYPISLNSPGPHGGPVWEWLGWSEKSVATRKYVGRASNPGGSISEGDYAILDGAGNLGKIAEVSPGLGFDVLLTANGFDHALLGAPGEHGQRFRQLFIDIKNQVWEARREKARGGARFMKAEAQKVATEVAIACGRNPVGESVQGSRFLWGEEPAEMRILAEAATGFKVKCHSDALDVQSLGLEFQRLGRQISYGESAQVAAQEVVIDARSKGWNSEDRYHKSKGYLYRVLEPRFDNGRLMTSGKAQRVNDSSVVDLAVGKKAPNHKQGTLF